MKIELEPFTSLVRWFRLLNKRAKNFAGDIEARYESYRVNALTIVAIIGLWWLLISLKVSLQSIPQPTHWGSSSQTIFVGLFVIPLVAYLFRFFQPLGYSPAILIAIGTAGLAYLYLACDPTTLFLTEQDNRKLSQVLNNQFAWTVVLSAIWLVLISITTLNKVFRNQRHKLLAFWYWFLASLVIITFCYALHAIFGFIVSLIAPHYRLKWLEGISDDKDVHVRGRKIVGEGRAGFDNRQALKSESESFHLGGQDRPLSHARTHVLTIGASGSGKTITLNQMMADILPLVRVGSNRRAVVYDAKLDVVSTLFGIVGDTFDTEIIILNPKDFRAVALDFAADIQSFSDIETFTNILVPPPGHNERQEKYWRDNPLQILRAVVEYLHLNARGVWTLRDIVNFFESEEILRAILDSDPRTRYALGLLSSDTTNANIFSSIRTEIYKYRILAARWEHATKKISLKQWIKQDGKILVLGRDVIQSDTVGTSTAVLNRYITTSLAQLVLSQPDTKEASTFLFFDEMHTIKLELVDLATQARSKGCCIFGAFQSIQSLTHFYGNDGVETILGQFQSKNFLRLDDTATAEWCSKLIGEAEVIRADCGYEYVDDGSDMGYGKKNNFNRKNHIHRVVLPAELTSIQPINAQKKVGLTGFYLGMEFYKHTYKWWELEDMFVNKDLQKPDFQPIPPDWEQLSPWTPADWGRLGISNIIQQLQLKKQAQQLQNKSKHSASSSSKSNGSAVSLTPPNTYDDDDDDAISIDDDGLSPPNININPISKLPINKRLSRKPPPRFTPKFKKGNPPHGPNRV
ncbi:type IV secretion system DNA-binding domain-containing protein [Brasilonema sp. CT11]|nr:type IV secretion system DNA-binding domain-containing protein [Brasilonema sp. CT11]